MRENLQNLSSLIRCGKIYEAQQLLESLPLSGLSRRETLTLADLARREGFPELAIRLLTPVVRPKEGKVTDASPAEQAVYAGALVKVGAIEEGLGILERLSPKKQPQVLLFRAHARIATWDYSAAIGPLVEYLKVGDLSPMDRLFGNLNLASCCVYDGDFENCARLLETLREDTKSGELRGFHGNALELSAQWAIGKKDWALAEKFLNDASAFFEDATSPYAFFVRRWRAILKLKKEGPTPKALAEIEKVRVEAQNLKLWESVRDCDVWRAVISKDTDLVKEIYYGTPFPALRKRLIFEFGSKIDIPEEWFWNRNAEGKVLDLFQLLEPRSLPYRLAAILVSDFYRPFRVGVLHAQLYPGEHFNPDSSPMRIYQAVTMLRKQFEELKLPVEVTSSDDGYQLRPIGNTRLRVPKKFDLAPKRVERENELQGKVPEVFTVQDVMGGLNISRSSAKRLLGELVESKKIEREGAGSSTYYYFPLKKAG